MSIPGPSARRRLLIEAVVVVAAEPSAQVAWLEKYKVAPDEIALGFDDAYPLAGRLIEEGHLDRSAWPCLQSIDEVFVEMTQDVGVDRWTRAALFTDMGWARARRLARDVLASEGEGDAPLPDICVIR
ncbi:hypothetical protein ACFV14_29800 [Streptomyces zaomyceticus]|uniref:hypothetical protein n=1 Tax=Streptomyces zaomyceticus TaxID=68286 RepID=UPI0036C9238B